MMHKRKKEQLEKSERSDVVVHKLCFVVLFFLVLWISFFPVPVHDTCNYITMFVLSAVFLVLLFFKKEKIVEAQDIFFIGFFFILNISVLFAQDLRLAYAQYFVLAVSFITLYYIGRYGFDSEQDYLRIIYLICISSIIVALFAIFETIHGVNPLYTSLNNQYYDRYINWIVRPMATQFNPAVLGSYMLMSLPFNFIFFKKRSLLYKIPGALGLFFGVIVLVLTFSRGALIGLFCAVSVYLLLRKHFVLFGMIIASLCVLLMVSHFFPYPFSRFSMHGMVGEGGMRDRFRIERYTMTKDILKDKPLFGVGLAHVRIRFNDYYSGDHEIDYEHRIMDNMHNTILVETGILGFLSWLVLCGAISIRELYAYLRSKERNEDQRQRVILLAGFAGILVHMMGYDTLYWDNPLMFFCLYIGCMQGLHRRIQHNSATVL